MQIVMVAHVMVGTVIPEWSTGAMWVHGGYTAFLSRSQKGKFPFTINGWRRSADRTRLRAESLLTGNFTGKLAILGAWRHGKSSGAAAMKPFCA